MKLTKIVQKLAPLAVVASLALAPNYGLTNTPDPKAEVVAVSTVDKKKKPKEEGKKQIIYGRNAVCGTNREAYIESESTNLQTYGCMTKKDAKAKGLNPEDGIEGKRYAPGRPDRWCPGSGDSRELCYDLSPLSPRCGDGTVDKGEVCDLGKLNSDEYDVDGGGYCKTDCSGLGGSCGDGVMQGDSEFCDDGNRDLGDGCSDICKIEEGYICRETEDGTSVCEAEGEVDVPVADGERPWKVSAEYGLLGDGEGLAQRFGVKGERDLSDKLVVDARVGYQHNGTDYERVDSPDPMVESKLLPDGTTYKKTTESNRAETTDSEGSGFVGIGVGYRVFDWLKARFGVDTRVGQEETARDYEKTIQLERNKEPLGDAKTIQDTTTDSETTFSLYPNASVEGCLKMGKGIEACLNGEAGYDTHTERFQGGATIGLGYRF